MNTAQASASQWRQALEIAPAQVIHRLSQIFNPEQNASRSSDAQAGAQSGAQSGAQKRKLKAITEPSRQCYRLLTASTDTGAAITFASGDFQQLMHYIGEQAGWHKEALLRIPGDTLHVIICMDEATGGNVLATSSNKRIYFFNLCVKELGNEWRKTAFLPWACIPAKDLAEENGPDMATVTRCILQDWVSQRLQQGSAIHGRRFKVHLDGFLADYDAVRLVFSCKKASGMKPCALCSNVLAKGRAEAEADDFFVTISSWEPSRFVGYDTTEFFNNYDEQLQKAERLNKSAQKEQEIFLGSCCTRTVCSQIAPCATC